MLPLAVGLAAAFGGYRTYQKHVKRLARLENFHRHATVLANLLENAKPKLGNKVHLEKFYEEYAKPSGVPEHMFKAIMGRDKLKQKYHSVYDLLKHVKEKQQIAKATYEKTRKELGNPHIAGLKSAFKWGATTAVAGGAVQAIHSALSAPPQPAYISPDYQEELETLMKFV